MMVLPPPRSPVQSTRVEGHAAAAAAAAHPAAGEEEARGGAQRRGAEPAAIANAGKRVRQSITGGVAII